MSQTSIIYHQLIGVSREAFNRHQFGIAYHALAGAGYCAGELRNVDLISEVENLAVEQKTQIEFQEEGTACYPTLYLSLIHRVQAVKILQNLDAQAGLPNKAELS